MIHILCQLLHTVLVQWNTSLESDKLLVDMVQIIMNATYQQSISIQSSVLIWIHSLTNCHSTSPDYWVFIWNFNYS